MEDFIWPRSNRGWLETLDLEADHPQIQESLLAFREYVRSWQGTVLLPVNQIILTLAQDLFADVTELAIAHKLAGLLRQAENTNPDWRLPELAGELAVIARNERRFLGFSADDTGFDPENYKGQVVVATMHKAKGLEWETVFIIGLNDGRFPTIRSLKDDQEEEERRLFYVAVTRAKEELYLCYPVTSQDWNGLGFLRPSRFIRELPADVYEEIVIVNDEPSEK